MCLTEIFKKCRKPYKGSGTGYKVFESKNGKLAFMFYSAKVPLDKKMPSFSERLIVRGKWLKSFSNKIVSVDDLCYESGFHVYAEIPSYVLIEDPELKRHKTVLVKWRGLKSRGQQWEGETLVVDEIFIPNDRKKR